MNEIAVSIEALRDTLSALRVRLAEEGRFAWEGEVETALEELATLEALVTPAKT